MHAQDKYHHHHRLTAHHTQATWKRSLWGLQADRCTSRHGWDL